MKNYFFKRRQRFIQNCYIKLPAGNKVQAVNLLLNIFENQYKKIENERHRCNYRNYYKYLCCQRMAGFNR